MAIRNRETKFMDDWINALNAQGWLKRGSKPTTGFCKYCSSDIDVSKAGIAALKQHEKTVKHKSRIKDLSNTVSLTNLITKEKSVSKPSSVEAEIRWSWHTALTSKSFLSEDDSKALFSSMFPDSDIAKQFSCARTKQTYLINFSIGPFCQQKVVESIKNGPYSISYDEADGLMMIMVRHIADGKIQNDMLDLMSLDGKFGAENCTNTIVTAIDNAGLSRRSCVSDFSDSCYTMRGARNGVHKRLQELPGFDNLLDVGGCSLHTISNSYRKATLSVFPEIPYLAEDVFNFFDRSHKRQIDFRKLQEEFASDGHKFLRYVEVRWLILLPCLQRLDEQWEPLLAFMIKQSDDVTSFRGKRLLLTIQKPDTRVKIRFLIHVFKLASTFEKRFQSSSVLIHKLHTELVFLLQNIAAQFIKDDVLEKASSIWQMDFSDRNNYLPGEEILVGQSTFVPLSPNAENSKAVLLLQFRDFYVQLTKSLAKKIPYDNVVIRNLSFLGMPEKVSSTEVVLIAKKLPNVILEDEIDSLLTEVRLFNLQERSTFNIEDPVASWSLLDANRFPLLQRLALACCTLYHGNSDAERSISKKHDLDSFEKRNCMSDLTRRNLLLARSYLSARGKTAADITIEKELVVLANKARSEYHHFLNQKRKEEEENAATIRKEEEEKRLKELALKDRERKNELQKILAKEKDVKIQHQEAESKAIEAEALMQKALSDLKAANDLRQDAAKNMAAINSEKDQLERKTTEKAAAKLLEEARTLKRKAESASLPKIFKKK